MFVHDRLTGLTTRVSVSSDGAQADARGFDRPARWSMFMSRPVLSANGRFAAFTSRAPNLVRDDWNGTADVFVHDLWTGRTIRVSLTEGGTEATGDSFVSGISADGRVVAFTSLADNLAGDTNGRRDVFVVRLRPGGNDGLEHEQWTDAGPTPRRPPMMVVEQALDLLRARHCPAQRLPCERAAGRP